MPLFPLVFNLYLILLARVSVVLAIVSTGYGFLAFGAMLPAGNLLCSSV